jgi:hypothetical protein
MAILTILKRKIFSTFSHFYGIIQMLHITIYGHLRILKEEIFMPYSLKQISLADIIDGLDESVAFKPVKLFNLLDQYFDISTYIPLKWHMEYNNWNGRPHKYSIKVITLCSYYSKIFIYSYHKIVGKYPVYIGDFGFFLRFL